MKKHKSQIIIIGGGMTFKNTKGYLQYLKKRTISLEKKVRWHGDYLDKKLGKKFQIIRPHMPLSDNAKYRDWKIHFERFFPYLKNNVILIGNSLGGVFLAKYLSEHVFPKKILSMYLTCAPFDNTLPEGDLVGGFKLKSNLSLLDKSTKNLTLMFSNDDDIVTVDHAEKYRKKLKNAKIIIFKNKNGHFKVPTLPELVKMLNNNIKRIKH